MRQHPPAIYQFLGFAPRGDLGPYTCYTSKRRAKVFFLRAPPKTLPSAWQRLQCDRWTLFAAAWRALPSNTRELWLTAARAARLAIGGYNLFLWYSTTQDTAALATICRQAGINPGDLI